MKLLISLYILISVVAQTVGYTLLSLHYQVNKEYITKAFCENQAQPELHCQGSCHLRKQLNTLDDRPDDTHQLLKTARQLCWICQPLPDQPLTPKPTTAQPNYLPYISWYAFLAGNPLFHPPQLLFHV